VTPLLRGPQELGEREKGKGGKGDRGNGKDGRGHGMGREAMEGKGRRGSYSPRSSIPGAATP